MTESATPLAPDVGNDPYAAAEAILGKLDAEEAAQGEKAETEAEEAKPATEEGVEAEAEETEEAEESEADPAEQETQAPQTYKVKVNGQEVEATLDELLNGYSRTQDYKAKTAEVAREREAANTAREQHLAGLNQAIHYAQTLDPVLAEGQKTDWVKLAQEDPVQYNVQRAQYEQRLHQVQGMMQQAQQLQQQQFQQTLEREHQLAMEAIPEWAEESSRDKLKADIKAFYQDVGFSEEEAARFTDHRAIRAAALALQYKAKADKYDALQAAKKTAEAKKVVTVPKVQKPAAGEPGKTGKLSSLKKQAIKSGKTDDIMNAVLAHLED